MYPENSYLNVKGNDQTPTLFYYNIPVPNMSNVFFLRLCMLRCTCVERSANKLKWFPKYNPNNPTFFFETRSLSGLELTKYARLAGPASIKDLPVSPKL